MKKNLKNKQKLKGNLNLGLLKVNLITPIAKAYNNKLLPAKFKESYKLLNKFINELDAINIIFKDTNNDSNVNGLFGCNLKFTNMQITNILPDAELLESMNPNPTKEGAEDEENKKKTEKFTFKNQKTRA